MNFLFFSAQYLPTVGGVERYTHNLCKTLTSLGHNATIVTSGLNNLPLEEYEGLVKIVRLPSYLLLNGRFPILKKNKEFKSLVTKVFNVSYDMAIINTRFYHLSVYAARVCSRKGIPTIVIEHGSAHLSLGSRFINNFVQLYEHIAIRQVKRYCSDFYGVSQSCLAWLEHFGVKGKGIIYNAIDVEEVNKVAMSSTLDVREQFNLKDKVSAVFSGRFLKEKGIYELLDAFRELENVVLVMAGDGPLYSEVLDTKPDNVYLTGQLSYSDSLALLKQADIFILPTYSEGFSTVTLEAAAFGLCIITTPTGGSPELIETMKSGILLENISKDSIVKSLEYVLKNEGFRNSSGESVKNTVKEKFSWISSAEKVVEISKEFLDKR